jgi:hypothetical protein
MIVSVKQIARFTPQDLRNADDSPQEGAPVYLIAPPSVMTKARWRSEVASSGAVMPSDSEVFQTLRVGVREIVADHMQEDLLALIDQWEDATNEDEPDYEKEGLDPVWAAGEKERRKQLEKRVNFFRNEMRSKYPPYAQKMADQQFYMEIAPYLAAKHFLAGWENVDAEFRQVNGRVPDEVLESIPPEHVFWIGIHAMGMQRPTRADEKNSAGASASEKNPKPSGRAKKAPGSA